MYFDTPEYCLSLLKQLLEEIYLTLPRVEVYLGTVLKILPGDKPWGATIPDDVGARVTAYNQSLKDLPAQYTKRGYSLVTVDTASSVITDDDLLADGVHPKPVVFVRMAQLWVDAIKA